MSLKVAVVILNWNGRKLLQQFLPSVIRHSESVAQVIVADNGSTDDSLAILEKEFPTVRIIRNDTNKGFTGGYNDALQYVDAEYFVLLNSDVEVTPNWIEPIITLMDSDKKIGACQPKILSYHDKTSFEYAGAGGGFIDHYGYPFCRGRIFNDLEKDMHQYDDTIPVFWATGACMFVRSEVYKQLGGLDTEFFAHMEEIDLCWRMQLAGNQVYYCGKSTVYHVGGGTLAKNNPRKTYLNFRNNLLMIYKNAGHHRSSILLKRRFFDLLAALKFLITNGKKDAKAVLEAHRDFRKMRVLYPASKTQKSTKTPPLTIYNHSILWDYYLCRRKKYTSLPKND